MLKAAAGLLAGFSEEMGDSKGAMNMPLRWSSALISSRQCKLTPLGSQSLFQQC
jgi:hypothetical protein